MRKPQECVSATLRADPFLTDSSMTGYVKANLPLDAEDALISPRVVSLNGGEPQKILSPRYQQLTLMIPKSNSSSKEEIEQLNPPKRSEAEDQADASDNLLKELSTREVFEPEEPDKLGSPTPVHRSGPIKLMKPNQRSEFMVASEKGIIIEKLKLNKIAPQTAGTNR